MSKRLSKQLDSFKYNGEPVKIKPGTLLLTCFCTLLLIIATFTQLTLKHPYLPLDTFFFLGQDLNNYDVLHHFIKTYRYIPQIPVIFFIISLLGRRFGLLSICMYIILGMFYPIFALGGGISYFVEYGFGYILAFIPAVFLVGIFLKNNTDILRICLISAVGVCTIHVLGILYMLFIATIRHASMELVSNWIATQSSVQILYDIVFSILAIYVGKLTKRIFWIIMC